MKKLLLIPTALAVTAMPLVSLVGCSNTDQPEDLEKYKVSKQEMENAISFKGVAYLQGDGVGIETEEGKSYKVTQVFECSPLITYGKNTTEKPLSSEPYFEAYVEYDIGTNKYIETSRTDPSQTTWDVNPDAGEDDFMTPEKYGEELLMFYIQITDLGKHYTFDEDKKCYSGSVKMYGIDIRSDFYFENKKLVKTDFYRAEGTDSRQMSVNFTYNQITPVPPTPGIK